jgi:hypothetical protein
MTSKTKLALAITEGFDAVENLRRFLVESRQSLDFKNSELNDSEIDLALTADGKISECMTRLDNIQKELNALL